MESPGYGVADFRRCPMPPNGLSRPLRKGRPILSALTATTCIGVPRLELKIVGGVEYSVPPPGTAASAYLQDFVVL